MNSVFKNTICFLFLSVLIPVMVSGQNTSHFDNLKQKFEVDYVFMSDFTHEYNDTFTGDQQVTTGVTWVGNEQYKVQNGESIMYVDGEISRVYDNTKNRVIVSDYIEEEDDFAPSRMLQGVDSTYNVEEYENESGNPVIELTSTDPFSVFSNVSIFLNEAGIPTRIIAIDQVENELITYFENGEFVQKNPEIFQFQYPEDAEEIDLRQGS